MEKMSEGSGSCDILKEAISHKPKPYSGYGLSGSCNNREKNNDKDIVVNSVIKSKDDLDNNIIDNYSNVQITSKQTTVKSSQPYSNNLPYEVKGEDNSYMIFYPDDIKKEVTCDTSETSGELKVDNEEENNIETEFSDVIIKNENFDYDDPQPMEEPSTSGGGVNNEQVEEEEEEQCKEGKIIQPDKKDIKGVYLCMFCDHESTKMSLLRAHINSNHSEQMCDHQCKAECYQKKYLMSNIMKQKKIFVCYLCIYKCKRKENLLRHLMTHTGERPYQCSLCDYGFISKSKLIRHIRTHTGEKPFHCDYCDYRCKDKSKLTIHVRIHTGEKPYQCDYCDYRSKDRSKLTSHERTHTGEKPYQCYYCDYRCKDNGTLTIHVRIHTGEKPYQCNFCEYKCRDKSTLNVHTRTHTSKKTQNHKRM